MKSRIVIAAAFVLLFAMSATAFAAPIELRTIFGDLATPATTAAPATPTPVPTAVSATPAPTAAPTPILTPQVSAANAQASGYSGIIPLLPPGVSEDELRAMQGQAAAPTTTPVPSAEMTQEAAQPDGTAVAARPVEYPMEPAQVEQILVDVRDNPSKYKFTYDELWLVARLIYAEGNNQTYESYKAMATVILNRLQSKKFPNTIEKVIFARSQFTVIDNEGFLTDIPTSAAFSAVIDVFINAKPILPAEIVYFRSERDETKWGKRVYYDTIDGNMYYS